MKAITSGSMNAMTRISDLAASEILDSRGNPTIAVAATLEGGTTGWAAVPSGASTGANEAVELRDGDTTRFGGKGVLKAVEHVRTTIAEALRGRDASDQRGIDRTLIALDGTENKAKLGANAILGVSLAGPTPRPTHRGSRSIATWGRGRPHPARAVMNIFNGGKHADRTRRTSRSSCSCRRAPTFREAVRYGCRNVSRAQAGLHDREASTNVGDEGGFAPNLPATKRPLR